MQWNNFESLPFFPDPTVARIEIERHCVRHFFKKKEEEPKWNKEKLLSIQINGNWSHFVQKIESYWYWCESRPWTIGQWKSGTYSKAPFLFGVAFSLGCSLQPLHCITRKKRRIWKNLVYYFDLVITIKNGLTPCSLRNLT